MSKNPFVVTGRIEPKYFCDRITKSARFMKAITNCYDLSTSYEEDWVYTVLL